MAIHKNVKAVLAQTSPVRGDFRLRKLEYVAGENRTATVHRESGCVFLVDLEGCYFSPRLSHERMRIAQRVQKGEVVVNMFAGVGSFSIVIARHTDAKRIYSVDVNPSAVQCMEENVRMNMAYGRVMPMLGDAREIIKEKLQHVADRVLMPLPEKAFEYLPCALLALKETGGWIHYYDSEHARKTENPVEKVELKVVERLKNLGVVFEIPTKRVVRTTGPNWYQVTLDISVKGDLGKFNKHSFNTCCKEGVPG